MKKIYEKPEIQEIRVEANQAIAACSMTLLGYQNSDKRANPCYSSYQEAYDAQPDPQSASAYRICPVYRVEETIKHEYWTETRSVYWEDWNNNGVYDSGDNVNNQQGNLPSGMTGSGAGGGAVMNS